jgi:hypothetical protein
MGPFNRELAPLVRAAIAANSELQERYALKQVGLAAAMAGALIARDIPEATGSVAAELGALAFKQAYATWIDSEEDQDLAQLSLAALDRLRATISELR